MVKIVFPYLDQPKKFPFLLERQIQFFFVAEGFAPSLSVLDSLRLGDIDPFYLDELDRAFLRV